jgi:hypothetical protein
MAWSHKNLLEIHIQEGGMMLSIFTLLLMGIIERRIFSIRARWRNHCWRGKFKTYISKYYKMLFGTPFQIILVLLKKIFRIFLNYWQNRIISLHQNSLRRWCLMLFPKWSITKPLHMKVFWQNSISVSRQSSRMTWCIYLLNCIRENYLYSSSILGWLLCYWKKKMRSNLAI